MRKADEASSKSTIVTESNTKDDSVKEDNTNKPSLVAPMNLQDNLDVKPRKIKKFSQAVLDQLDLSEAEK